MPFLRSETELNTVYTRKKYLKMALLQSLFIRNSLPKKALEMCIFD